MKQKLIQLIEEARNLTSNGAGDEWLQAVREDTETNRVSTAHIMPTLRGYVRGLYTAGAIDHEALDDFDKSADEKGLLDLETQHFNILTLKPEKMILGESESEPFIKQIDSMSQEQRKSLGDAIKANVTTRIVLL